MYLRHGTSLLSTPDQFGPVLLLYVSKNDDEEHCFLKLFGFIDNFGKRNVKSCTLY